LSTHTLIRWATDHPVPAAVIAGAVLLLVIAAVWAAVRAVRSLTLPPGAVLLAGFAAMVCTAYSADSSWRFAERYLGMTNTWERTAMFAAAEIALMSCGIMARANVEATTTEDRRGTPGVPGTLVWGITGVQIIPCYALSGPVGGTVRAFIGPVLAGLLWHLAMGLEVKLRRPRALSSGLLRQIGHELRERLLARLGLAQRGRDAVQISRDLATARAVRLASRRWLGPWGKSRLAAAVARACVGLDPNQKHRLMQQLAARRSADDLRTVALPSPWQPEPAPARPRTLGSLVHQALTDLDPLEAVRLVQAAHPDAGPAEVASLCTAAGVVVTEAQVCIATGRPTPAAARTRTAPRTPATDSRPAARRGLILDLAPMLPAGPEMTAPVVAAAAHPRTRVDVRLPDPDTDEPSGPDARTPTAPGQDSTPGTSGRTDGSEPSGPDTRTPADPGQDSTPGASGSDRGEPSDPDARTDSHPDVSGSDTEEQDTPDTRTDSSEHDTLRPGPGRQNRAGKKSTPKSSTRRGTRAKTTAPRQRGAVVRPITHEPAATVIKVMDSGITEPAAVLAEVRRILGPKVKSDSVSKARRRYEERRKQQRGRAS